MKSLYEITGDIKDFNTILVNRSDYVAMQAKIDALMLEFCPDEMSKEQLENWAKHQQRSTVEFLPEYDEDSQ